MERNVVPYDGNTRPVRFSCVLGTSPHLLLALLANVTVESVTIFELPMLKGDINTREEGDLPSAKEFLGKRVLCDATNARTADHTEMYAGGGPSANKGVPVLFKGAAKKMKAFQRFATDASLLEHYPDARLTKVEFAKKETRTDDGEQDVLLSDFLSRYNTSDMYAVSDLPAPMKKDVELLPFLKCGE